MFPLSTRILILDDMLTMRKIVKKALRDVGFTEIQEATDGHEGWAVLEGSALPIQLIVSDWNMPNCTGLEFLKKVRADARFAKLPFILLTAEAEVHQVKEALIAGVTNYIVKPFTPDTLRMKLDQTYQKITSSGAASAAAPDSAKKAG